HAASAVWRTSEEDTLDHVGVLLSHSLVEWDLHHRRYHLHDLTRVYAGQNATPAEASSAMTFLSLHFAEVANDIQNEYNSGTDGAYRALARFDLERDNITSGFLQAALQMEMADEAATTCSAYVFNTARCRELRFIPLEQIA